jgi:hypothetical protein
MATGDPIWDFGKEHGKEYLEQYQKGSKTGIYDPEINSFEEWLQNKYHLESHYLRLLSYIFTEDSRLELIDDHVSPIKTSTDFFTPFLVGIVHKKYKNLSIEQIKEYIYFLRRTYKEYVEEKEIAKEQDRIVARDKWDREHPFSPYNPNRTWSEAIFGGKKSPKKLHKKLTKKLHKKSAKKLHKKSYKK